MADCGKLSKNFDFPCEVKVGGVNDRMFIVNFADINRPALLNAYETGKKVSLTDLPLIAGKKGFYYQGSRGSITPDSTFAPVGFFSEETHQVRFTIFSSDKETKEELESMKSGRFVVVTENNDGDFEVWGLGAGLVMKEYAYTPTVSETRRTFSVLFASADNVKEPYKPATLLKGTPAATLAYLESIMFVSVAILPASIGDLTAGTAATIALTQTGLNGTPVWSVLSGTLPTGLVLNTSLGILSGTPSASGTYLFTIQVTDGVNTQSKVYTVIVA